MGASFQTIMLKTTPKTEAQILETGQLILTWNRIGKELRARPDFEWLG